MARVKKAEVSAPVLKSEDVNVPVLGGDVGVRQLGLVDFLQSNADMVGRSQHEQVAIMLSWAVIDADGERLFTADEWTAWGNAGNLQQAISLYNTAMRLNFEDQEAAVKNSEASPT